MSKKKRRNPSIKKETDPPIPNHDESSEEEGFEWEEVTGTVADRRVVPDRRGQGSSGDFLHEDELSSDTGLERRRGPGRRRSDMMRAAEEGEMTEEQFLFLMAIDAFKRVNNVAYPTWSDILEILRRLGYRKVQASQINLPNAEDWIERSDAPLSPSAGVDLTNRTGNLVDDEDIVDDDLIADADAFGEAA